MEVSTNTSQTQDNHVCCSDSAQNVRAYQAYLAETISQETHGNNDSSISGQSFENLVLGIRLNDFTYFNSQTGPPIHLKDGLIDSVARTHYQEVEKGGYTITKQMGVDYVGVRDLSLDWKLEENQPELNDYFAEGSLVYAGQLIGLRAKNLTKYLDIIDQYHSYIPEEAMYQSGQAQAVGVAKNSLAADAVNQAKWARLTPEQVPDFIKEDAVNGAHLWVASALEVVNADNVEPVKTQLVQAHSALTYLDAPCFISHPGNDLLVFDFDDAVFQAQQKIIDSIPAWQFRKRQEAVALAADFYEQIGFRTGEGLTPTQEVAVYLGIEGEAFEDHSETEIAVAGL